MASSQQPPPPRLSDFTLKKKLGEGSYSQVSLALRKLDGLDYALKQVNIAKLNEKERENALNEVRFLASIRHKNIIGYRAAFIDDQTKTLCIVMEFANDGDLLGKVHEMRRKGTFFSEQEIWRIFIQLALGLQCLHQMNIMHRDLKPANIFLWKGSSQAQQMNNNSILIEDEGKQVQQAQQITIAKIGDMNVSKLAQLDGLNYTQTGTPYYASPEVWKDQPYDFKSDVWSLGCILYEMTALKAPFQARDMDELFKKVTKGSYQKVPSVYSPDLSAMIKSLLTVEPSLRPSINQVLSMPSIQTRFEKLFPEEALCFINATLQNQSTISNKKSSRGVAQQNNRAAAAGSNKKSIGLTNAHSCTLLETIRDTKDLKALKNQLPKANFEANEEELGKIVTNYHSILKDVDVNSSIMSGGNPLLNEDSMRVSQAAPDNNTKKSSMTLLARNQSQQILNMSRDKTNSNRQLQILPSLVKNNKDYSEKMLQRLKESNQQAMMMRSGNKLNKAATSSKGKMTKNSRNGHIDISYNSISQEDIKQDSGRVSIQNSGVQQKNLMNMERARSEQRLLNINTPSTNLLPILDVVNELPSKKMNLKSMNKRILKHQTQNPTSQLLQNSKNLANLKPPMSPSQSPKRQYGAAVTSNINQKLISEHASLNNSLIKRDKNKTSKETRIIARESSIDEILVNQSMQSQKIQLDIESLQRSKKKKNALTNRGPELLDGIRLQLPFNQNDRSMQLLEKDSPRENQLSLKPQILRNGLQQPMLEGLYLSSEVSNKISPRQPQLQHQMSPPIKKGDKSLSNSKSIGSMNVVYERQSEIFMNLRHQTKQQHLKPFSIQELKTDMVNHSLLNESVEARLNESRLGNQSMSNPPAKMKPVKVIPSSRRRKEQLLGSLQPVQNPSSRDHSFSSNPKPFHPLRQQASQLISLRPSNSNINLYPIQILKGATSQLGNIANSQKTTVTQAGESIVEQHIYHHHTMNQNRYEENSNERSSMVNPPSMNQHSKPLLLPLRQQLYMDERNPFLDEYTLNKVRVDTNTNKGQKTSLIGYNDILMDHYSTKNSNRQSQGPLPPGIIYQVQQPAIQGNRSQMKNNNELHQINNNSSMLLQENVYKNHKRNNSSFDYADPRSVRSGSQLNVNHSFGQKLSGSHMNPMSDIKGSENHDQQQKALALPSLTNNNNLMLNQLQTGIQPIMHQNANPRSSSSSSYISTYGQNHHLSEAEKAKRKNRIGLLEKARKVLIDQQQHDNNNQDQIILI